MAINVREKGKRLERKVASLIRKKGLDRRAGRTPMSGAMPQWKGDILTDLPLHIECKNTERIKFWQFWEQASSQCPMAHDSVLVVSSNHRPIIACVEVDFLLNLLKTEQEYLQDINNGDTSEADISK